ncbi:MAG: exonuclease domain-containing protein [Lachnospiraceae bacterium]
MTRNKGKRLNLYAKDYVVFDLETTGLSPAEDEIIELSGIKVRDNQVVEEFSTLVNPGRPIPFSATRINGITDKMVKTAPVLSNALGDFLDFAGEDILVGHNIHTFDTNFLYDGALRELGKEVQNDYVDTLYLAKSCLPMLSHHRLTDVAEYFQIETKGAHRALNDCNMNQQCYEKLGGLWEKKQALLHTNREQEAKTDGLQTACPECGCLLVKRKGRFGEFWGCTGFPLCRYTRKA